MIYGMDKDSFFIIMNFSTTDIGKMDKKLMLNQI
jgi:hypothetical protein